MFKLRLLYCLVGALLSAVGSQALDIITINGQKVVAGSVVAKLKEPNVGAARALHSSGVKVEQLAASVPGLVQLTQNEASGLRPLSAREKEVAMLDWIGELKATGLYEFVEPEFVHSFRLITPNDARFVDGTLWGLRNNGQGGGVPGADVGIIDPVADPNATNAWDYTTGSTNVIVAVVDSGIRTTHRDLANQMWVNADEIAGNGVDDDLDGYVDNIHGVDAVTTDGEPEDNVGHGTHVAGTIGAAATPATCGAAMLVPCMTA